VKIGILSREYPPLTHVGGIATYSATAARLLADRGHEVHVVCNGPETRIERREGIAVHRVAMLNHHFPAGRLWYPWRSAYRKHLPHYLDALTWARTAAAYLERGLDFASFDAWEWPETMGEGALAPVAGAGSGPVRVCRVHTGWMDEYADNPLERALLLRLQRRACERASRVVSPTRYMAERYAGPLLGYRGEVEVSRNPLRLWDEPVDWSLKSMRHVLYAGRVEWRKGLQVLLRALEAMGPAADGLRVRVVGHRHPPTRERDRECLELFEGHLARHAPGAGAGYTLEYAGPSPHDGMRKHYDWAGVLVLPSLMENYPYAALEGLSRGCLLLGSEAGGIPEIIDRPGRGGLFPAGDHASLARKMGQLCRHASLPDDLKRNAEEMRAEFGPDACYGRLLRTYALEPGKGAARRGL
jgi:glycosyltransferase involved in cell wall biosynthesis